MAKPEKTHAMRVLEARGIAYRVVTYDPSAAFHSAEEAATLLGVDAATVYKTLVVLRDDGSSGKPLLVIIPAANQVDLKLLAKSTGAKRLRMATQREAETLTSMQVGGISALALTKPLFDIVIDTSARALDEIHVSAGKRGLDLALQVDDLVAVTSARYVDACSG